MRFEREQISESWDEMLPLAQAHHKELRFRWAFNPKRKVYENLERAGCLRVFTMRGHLSGMLVGYQVFNVLEHPHMDLRVAHQDTLYVIPEYRGFAAGRFTLWVDERLAETGVGRITRIVPRDSSPSQLLRMGYDNGDMILNLEAPDYG